MLKLFHPFLLHDFDSRGTIDDYVFRMISYKQLHDHHDAIRPGTFSVSCQNIDICFQDMTTRNLSDKITDVVFLRSEIMHDF